MRKPKLAHRIFEKWQNSKASRVFTVCCSLSLFLHDKFLLPSSALTIRAGRSDGNNEEPAVVYSEDVSYPKERSLSGGASSTEADNPAPYDGQYCRGGACQYRTPPPPKPKPKPDEPPTVAIPPAFDAPDKREFCTGLGCLGGMGFPVAASAATFNENCVELTDVIAGGFEVDPHSKTVRLRQALANFNKWCTARVTADEAGACAVAFTDDAKTKNGEYADVMTMALSNVAKASAVGDVCSALGGFLGAAKAAQDKLQLTMESLKSAGNAMLDIGKKMKYSDDSTATSAQSGNQASAVPTSKASAKSQIGLTWWQQKPGQYVGAPPCDTYDALKSPPKSYLIRAGLEISSPLYEFCNKQFGEIFGATPTTGESAATKVKNWCRWKVASQKVGKAISGVSGDGWSNRDCNGMVKFVGFAVRHELDQPMNPMKICKNLFVAQSLTNRVQSLVDNALSAPSRER